MRRIAQIFMKIGVSFINCSIACDKRADEIDRLNMGSWNIGAARNMARNLKMIL